MKKVFIAAWMSVMAIGMNAPAYGGKAHVHGNAAMQVAVEGGSVEIALQSPLDSLVGFEHAPRNDKQRKAIQNVQEQFRMPASLFVPTAAAQCTAQPAELMLPFEEKAASTASAKEVHSELEATIRFQCENPSALKGMEVKLFDAFPRLHKLNVQLVNSKGQAAARLTPKQRILQW